VEAASLQPRNLQEEQVRKVHLIGVVAGALALALSAVAVASPQFKQTVSAKYSTSKAQQPAGLSVNLSATDPGAVPPGAQPGVKTVKITFSGAKVDFKAAKLCTQPKDKAESCPSNTKIGSGTASANLVGTNATTGQKTVTQNLGQTVSAYAVSGGIYLIVKGTSLPTTAILKATLSKKGALNVNVERDLPVIPGGNKIVLTDFAVKIKKITKGKGTSRKEFITTPKCGKSKKFKITSNFVYEDGSKKNITTTQKCKS
jgi:hypothetical protein